jgi:DNA-binding CsgD family transcriptional regulator
VSAKIRKDSALPESIEESKFIHCLYRDLLEQPELAFANALASLQHCVGATAGLAQLRDTRTGEMIPLATNNYTEQARKSYDEYFCSIDPWQQRFISNQISNGVNSSDDIIPRSTFRATEFYHDYWNKLGFGDAIGVFGRVGKFHAYTFGLPRLRLHGSYTLQHKQMLEPLRPHFHNAVALTLEVELQKRKAQIHNPLVEQLPIAIFLVDQRMQLLDYNHFGQQLLADAQMFTDQNGALHYHHNTVQAQLLNMLKGYSRVDSNRDNLRPEAISGCSHSKGLPAHNIYLLPVFDGYLLSFQIVVTVADERMSGRQMISMLTSLFGLTEAEAEVSASLFNGCKPAEIAVARGVSVATVRTQLKAIMAKAQCNSQLELVRRISQLVIPFR